MDSSLREEFFPEAFCIGPTEASVGLIQKARAGQLSVDGGRQQAEMQDDTCFIPFDER
jgi:hypothetical protein